MKFLRRLFAPAALLWSLFFAAPVSAQKPDSTATKTAAAHHTPKTRHLTPEEIALARPIFGDAIDYAKVKVSAHPGFLVAPRERNITLHNKIHMAGGDYSENYGTSSDVWAQSSFIHEMAHIWQRQNGVFDLLHEALRLSLKYKFTYRAAYFYAIDSSKDLLQYNMEQQAAIIADYFYERQVDTLKYAGLKPEVRAELATAHVKNMQMYESALGSFIKNPAYANPKLAPKFRR